MNWTDITREWPRSLRGLRDRFPYFDEKEMSRMPRETTVMAEHLARQHDLTPLEAEEELKDWLYIQSLARQASEIEAT